MTYEYGLTRDVLGELASALEDLPDNLGARLQLKVPMDRSKNADKARVILPMDSGLKHPADAGRQPHSNQPWSASAAKTT
jgi:hypothetical protein